VRALNCPDPPDLEPLVRTLHQFLIGAGVLVVLQFIFRQWAEQVFRFSWRGALRFARKRFLCGVVLFVSVVGLRLALLPRLPVPVPGIHDEFSYLLMGDTFAHGRLSNPAHPMWVSFETFHVNWFPRYASMYPPAQGLVLAIGERLGHPWIGVLLSCAVMCVAIYWMLLAWLPPRWAMLGGIIAWLKFGIASYWINSYWGGAVAAIGGSLLCGALTRILRRARVRDAIIFAVGLAILANSRPYEGLVYSLPSLFVLSRWFFRKANATRRPIFRRSIVLLPVASVLLLTGMFMGYYNFRLTGHPLLFPHTLNVRTYHSAPMFLFQPMKPMLHYNNQQFEDFYNGWEREEYDGSWKSVLCLSWLKSVRFFCAYTWWGLLLALPAVPSVCRDRKMRVAWLALLLVTVATYIVVWSNAHYAAPVTCVAILLALQTLRHLRLMRSKNWRWGAILARTSVLLLLVDTTAAVTGKNCDTFYWTCQGDVSRLTIQRKLEMIPGKHLVMVRYSDDHNIHDDWVYNGAEIDSAKVIWAREISAEQNLKLFNYFADRKVWLVTPDKDNTVLEPYAAPEDSDDSSK
jgi:hypothetical protein